MYSNTRRVFRYTVNNFSALFLTYFVINYQLKCFFMHKSNIFIVKIGYLLALPFKLFEPKFHIHFSPIVQYSVYFYTEFSYRFIDLVTYFCSVRFNTTILYLHVQLSHVLMRC